MTATSGALQQYLVRARLTDRAGPGMRAGRRARLSRATSPSIRGRAVTMRRCLRGLYSGSIIWHRSSSANVQCYNDCTYNVFVRYRRMSRGHYAPSCGEGWEALEVSDMPQIGQEILQLAFQGVFGSVWVGKFHTAAFSDASFGVQYSVVRPSGTLKLTNVYRSSRLSS
jgi:hypothetical protein